MGFLLHSVYGKQTRWHIYAIFTIQNTRLAQVYGCTKLIQDINNKINMSLYFKIWVDAIIKIRKNPLRKEDWKWMVQSYMAVAMALNLMFLSAIIQRNILNFAFYDIEINIFSTQILNDLISGFILFFLPPILVNYLLVFKNNKYIALTEKYKTENGNYFFRYFFTSLFVPLLILIIALLLR